MCGFVIVTVVRAQMLLSPVYDVGAVEEELNTKRLNFTLPLNDTETAPGRPNRHMTGKAARP